MSLGHIATKGHKKYLCSEMISMAMMGTRNRLQPGTCPSWLPVLPFRAMQFSGLKCCKSTCLGPWTYHSHVLYQCLYLLLLLKGVQMLGVWPTHEPILIPEGYVSAQGHIDWDDLCYNPGPSWCSGLSCDLKPCLVGCCTNGDMRKTCEWSTFCLLAFVLFPFFLFNFKLIFPYLNFF